MADDDVLDLIDGEPEDDLDAGLLQDDLTEGMIDAVSDATAPTGGAGYTEPMMDLPACKATLQCLRGPCQHHCFIESRMAKAGRDDLDLRIKGNRYCFRHFESTNLGSQNIFQCSQWWPAGLAFVPESLRALMRGTLNDLWEVYLRHVGYDFDSWRVWPRDVWTAMDRPEYRGKISLDGVVRPPTLHDYQNEERKRRRAGNGAKRVVQLKKPPYKTEPTEGRKVYR